MKALVLGLSSIAQRRVIPALAALADIERIDVATRSKTLQAALPKTGQCYSDYGQAIAQSDAELVYISLPNSLHEEWIGASLAANKHVVVDKPAALTLDGAERAIALAARKGRLIAEATTFNYHPHISEMLNFVTQNGPLTHIDAQFIIPPLPKENFRSSRALGGGCLLDMGPYAAAIARIFGSKLEQLSVFGAPVYPQYEVDMGFTLAASYAGGLRYVGHFSFESEYQNRLCVVCRHGSVLVERIFSLPPDAPVVWNTRKRNAAAETIHPAADAFRHFFEAIIGSLRTGDYRSFADDLLADATFRASLSKHLALR